MPVINHYRADRAKAALSSATSGQRFTGYGGRHYEPYADNQSLTEAATDLLADLMHLEFVGKQLHEIDVLDFDTALRLARMHFHEEVPRKVTVRHEPPSALAGERKRQ